MVASSLKHRSIWGQIMRGKTCLAAAAAIVMATGGSALAAPPTFAPPQSFDVGHNRFKADPIDLAVGDLNGDGRPDIATANLTDSSVSVLLKDRVGSGYSPAGPPTSTTDPGSVAIGDFNADGRPDLVTANPFDDTATVLLKDDVGPGYTPLSPPLTTGHNPLAVRVADLNGDGRPDIVTADHANGTGAGTLSVFLKDASGPGFTALDPAPKTGATPDALAIADLNGDGRPDLVTANGTDYTVSILLKDASGPGYTALDPAPKTGKAPTSLAVGDLNGDGRPDIVTSNDLDSTLTLLRKDASGPGYTPSTLTIPGRVPGAVAIGDVNGDGRPDIVTGSSGFHQASGYSVLVKDASGPGFTPMANPPETDMPPRAIELADLNGDGQLDIAATDVGPDTATVILNATDLVAPTSSDDVPSSFQHAPVTVHLSASDAGGAGAASGVASILYTTGVDPADPSVAANHPATYDPASPPVLGNGERVRYFSTDNNGNAETPHTSAAAKVDIVAPVTRDDVPATPQKAPVTVTLTATDTGGSGVASTRYAIIDADGSIGGDLVYDAAHRPILKDGQKIRYASVDNLGNAETPHMSAVVKIDQAAPVTRDDVPTTPEKAPVTVTLTATDTGGSGVAATRYAIIDSAGNAGSETTYDPAHPPVLQDGQRIRYFSTDQAGNAETPHTSVAVKVTPDQPVTQPQPPPPVSAPMIAPLITPTPLVALLNSTSNSKSAQLLLDKTSISVQGACGPVACTVTATATVKLNGHTIGSLHPTTATLSPQQAVRLRLASTRALRAKVRHAVRHHHKTTTTITVNATFTEPGQAAQRKSLTITLRTLRP